MNGSEKQIKWAEDIKASKNFGQYLGKGRTEQANASIAKAVEFIASVDHAGFWIEYKDASEMDIMSKFMRSGILIKGWQWQDKATIDMTTGAITVTTYDCKNQPHTQTI